MSVRAEHYLSRSDAVNETESGQKYDPRKYEPEAPSEPLVTRTTVLNAETIQKHPSQAESEAIEHTP